MAKAMSKGEKLDLIVREIAKLQKQIKIVSAQQTKLCEDVIRLTKAAAGSNVLRSGRSARAKRPADTAAKKVPAQNAAATTKVS